MKPSTPPVELSLVIPCYNEHETIVTCVEKALKCIRQNGLNAEVIVADNNSSDQSAELALKAGAHVVPVAEKGYGAALRGGIAAARGEFVIMGDADDSYDFLNFMPILEKLREGYELVMGNRFRGGIRAGAMPFLHQYLGNPGLTFLAKCFFRSPVGDIYCGLRGFRRETIQGLNLRSSGMEFAIEMVVKCTLFQKRIAEVPIILYPDGRSGKPHLRTWRDGWRTLRFMLLYAPKWLFFLPAGALFAFGTIFGALLMRGPLVIGGIGFDISSLLIASMSIILSVQLFSFFFFARIFATTEGYLPPTRRFASLFKHVKLETGIASGLILITGGVIVLGFVLARWKSADFGQLSYPDTLRRAIPAVTAITVGVQVFFSSFLMSILGLARQR